ncbi:MAG: complex I NDUFA9 subunit family protein, partial [Magnetovibrio sp.]|nr:complex I NDUFA9 subunit family protein [Magnetovibrio sp.]
PADVTHADSVAAAVRGADVVINLVGILYESGRATFQKIHVDGAANVAQAAAAAGVQRLVHVSALGADASSPAKYARSKAAGEAAVTAAFPKATILRPSVVFGPEDDFFNRFASMARLSPVLPVIGAASPKDGGPKFQPVYVADVADAIMAALTDAKAKGQLFELGGPTVYSFRELMQLVMAQTGRKRCLLPLPYWVADIQAAFLGLLPRPPLTLDQVQLLRRDNVVGDKAKTLKNLGITPTAAEAILPTYLMRFRNNAWQGVQNA